MSDPAQAVILGLFLCFVAALALVGALYWAYSTLDEMMGYSFWDRLRELWERVRALFEKRQRDH